MSFERVGVCLSVPSLSGVGGGGRFSSSFPESLLADEVPPGFLIFVCFFYHVFVFIFLCLTE